MHRSSCVSPEVNEALKLLLDTEAGGDWSNAESGHPEEAFQVGGEVGNTLEEDGGVETSWTMCKLLRARRRLNRQSFT